MAIASCGESGTFVLLDIEYGDLADVDELQITGVAADGTQLGTNVTGRVSRARIQLPDDTDGEVTLTVAASLGGVRRGYGQDRILVRPLQENSAQVLLRMPCGAWCEPGQFACDLDGADAVVRCTLPPDGNCFEYEPASDCASGETCSLGECSTTCVDECTAGEPMCAGPQGSRQCATDFDTDPCFDLGPIEPCADGTECSGGACRGECIDECTFGVERCMNGRTSFCGDRNLDGCSEWSPEEVCPAPGPSCDSEGLVTYEPSCQAGECSVTEVHTPCSCDDGVCVGGCDPRLCTDPGPCQTADGATCEAGCAYPPDPMAACDDGLACTVGDSCSEAGECVGVTECLAEPECNRDGDGLIISTGGMCVAEGCSFTMRTEPCECIDDTCVETCTPNWTSTTLGTGDLNARLAIAPGGQVHLARLRPAGVQHSSPPQSLANFTASGAIDFSFHMTSDGTPHIFAQLAANVVRHYYRDVTWITDSRPLNNAISFAVAVTPGDLFDYYYRSPDGGILHEQCMTQPNCTWTLPLPVTDGGGPIDAVAGSDTTSYALMNLEGATYIAERTGPMSWLPVQLSTAPADRGALTIGPTGFVESAFRSAGNLLYGRPPGIPTMLANNAINNVDIASNGEDTFVAWHAAVSEGLRITNTDTGTLVYSASAGAGSPSLPQIEFDASGGVHILYQDADDELVYATAPCL